MKKKIQSCFCFHFSSKRVFITKLGRDFFLVDPSNAMLWKHETRRNGIDQSHNFETTHTIIRRTLWCFISALFSRWEFDERRTEIRAKCVRAAFWSFATKKKTNFNFENYPTEQAAPFLGCGQLASKIKKERKKATNAGGIRSNFKNRENDTHGCSTLKN